MSMDSSLLITWIYFGAYCTFFFVLSLWAAITVKTEHKLNKQRSADENTTTRNEAGSTPTTKPIDEDKEEEEAGSTTTTEQNDDEKTEDIEDTQQNNAYRATAIEVTEADNSEVPEKKHGFFHYFKRWAKLTWQKKKIYLSIIPHLFDQATDYGVIMTYHSYIDDPDISALVSVEYWFYLSILIVVLHRIVSTFGVWLLTRNWTNVCLQAFDLLMIRAVWTSYKLNTSEPSISQRYLGLLEATFEGTN